MLYRRAEGLRYTLRPCDPTRVIVDVPERGSSSMLERDEARLLGRLHQWRTAAELGCTAEALESLVARDLVYFFPSERRPRHVLGATPLPSRDGPVALRRNLRLELLVKRARRIDKLPFMPRHGSLDGAELAGLDVRVIENDAEVATLRLSCCAPHAAALRALIPRLDGRHSFAELSQGDAAGALEALDLAGLVERWSPPDWPGAPPQVTWLGHAALLYEAGRRRLVVDPLFATPSEPPRRAAPPGSDEPFDPRRLGPVDAILITHGDNDHLNAESLLRFDGATPLYLPRAAPKMAYQVDLQGVARLLGFAEVHFLDEWQRTRVGDVELVAAPFTGEDWGLDLPKRTYLLTHPSLTVYLAADSAFQPEVYRRLAAEHPRIDLACLGVAGCAEPHASGRELGYGHFYREWIPPSKLNEWIALTCSPEESAEAAQLLGARQAFGYAAGASFMPMSYSDRGSHAELAELLQRTQITPLALPLGTPVRVS